MTTSRDNHRIKYGPEHRKLREAWKPIVEVGGAICAHPGCGRPILAGAKWDLGHRYSPEGWPLESMPMHPACNRNTAHSDRERDMGRFNTGDQSEGPKTSRKWGPE